MIVGDVMIPRCYDKRLSNVTKTLGHVTMMRCYEAVVGVTMTVDGVMIPRCFYEGG